MVISDNKEGRARTERAAKTMGAAVRVVSTRNNRLAVLALTLPLLLVVGLGLHTMARRIWSDQHGGRQLNQSREAAVVRARAVCAEITHAPVTPENVTRLTAYSLREKTSYAEWNVICDTDWGIYSLRVNARTNRVYAVNVLKDEPSYQNKRAEALRAGFPLVLSGVHLDRRSTETATGNIKATRHAAEKMLPVYFRTLGIAPESLGNGLLYAEASLGEPTDPGIVWTFTYRVPSSHGIGLVKIGIDSRTGRLVNYWNPTDAR